MLILFATPVIVAVAFVHRVLQAVAPSYLLVRSVRSARPGGRVAAALLGLAVVLFLTMHVVATAISAGAPEWLNLVVLVLAWDALKVGWLAVDVLARGIARGPRRSVGRAAQVPAAGFVGIGPGPRVSRDLGIGRVDRPINRRLRRYRCASPVDEQHG